MFQCVDAQHSVLASQLIRELIDLENPNWVGKTQGCDRKADSLPAREAACLR
jgi:hypothetical protein